MNLEKKIKSYKEQQQISPKEEKILSTIYKCKETFYDKEQERLLTYWEFLWGQLRLVQKRWWLLQALLLILVGIALPSLQEGYFVQRSMGVAGTLFVIFIIPELWRNRTSRCIEIEASSYYSLRQIYAARIMLFGIVDVLLITVFCGVMNGRLHFTLLELLSQFLFPMAITACICFGILCNKYSVSEITSIVLCIIWSAVWWLITVNEKIYTIIALPAWVALLGIAITFLTVVVYKILNDCNRCWEANLNEIENN